jgi:hypothetical protein
MQRHTAYNSTHANKRQGPALYRLQPKMARRRYTELLGRVTTEDGSSRDRFELREGTSQRTVRP